jgi:hypothetical protein
METRRTVGAPLTLFEGLDDAITGVLKHEHKGFDRRPLNTE